MNPDVATKRNGRPAFTWLVFLSCFVMATTKHGLVHASSLPLTIYNKCMMDDTIINADLWADEPMIMSAGFGFADILGCASTLTNETVHQCGGSWNFDLICTVCTDGTKPHKTLNASLACGSTANAPPQPPPTRSLTAAAPTTAQVQMWGASFSKKGGLPICFSWPVVMSTVSTGVDFEFTKVTILPDGSRNYSKVYAVGRSSFPNYERNEKHCVVVTGDWGARLPSNEPGASWPVNLTIRNDPVSPLMLVGPNGPISAVGLSIDTTQANPYDLNNGPKLLAAKVSRMNITGEGGNAVQERFCAACNPNHGVALYGTKQAKFRLRIFYSGGFTQNGVNGMRPTDYVRFFRVVARHNKGHLVHLVSTGVVYHLPEPVEILGLADLGRKQQAYDYCYDEDKDNYIDIVLKGSKAAMKRLKTVLLPAGRFQGKTYDPVYNPGGPGFTPFKDVTYTQPSPKGKVEIQHALDDPKVVSYYPPGGVAAICNT